MLMDDGETPVLMDFGSACPARVEVHNRQEALKQQVRDTFGNEFYELKTNGVFILGYCCRTLYNALSSSRTFRCEDRDDIG